MNPIYEAVIRLLLFVVRIRAKIDPKTEKWLQGQAQWRAKLLDAKAKQGASKWVWFHAASLGEFEQARPVVEKHKELEPDTAIALTFFSPSGYEIRKDYAVADLVCYLPADTSANAEEFIKLLQPSKSYFVKYEFWFNYLRLCKKHNIEVVLFSAIFRPSQVFFQWYGGFFRKLLGYYKHIYLQDESSAALLKSVHINHFSVAGDTRFDRVAQIAAQAKDLPKVAEFKGNYPLLVCGSTWQEDIDVLLPAINVMPELKVIIAPHELREEKIAALENAIKGGSIRYSNFSGQVAQVMIIDNIGMLSSIYRYADICYVGGAFKQGLHNILEAVVYGKPVLFGNVKYEKFKEALDLINEQVAFTVADSSSAQSIISGLLKSEEAREEIYKKALKYMLKHQGATDQIIWNEVRPEGLEPSTPRTGI